MAGKWLVPKNVIDKQGGDPIVPNTTTTITQMQAERRDTASRDRYVAVEEATGGAASIPRAVREVVACAMPKLTLRP